MKEPCTIKSFDKGITIILDNDISFEDLVLGVCHKFSEVKEFFGKKDLALAIEGRRLTREELSVVIEAIELNSEIHIVYYQDKTEHFRDVEALYLDMFDNAQIIDHSVDNKDDITSEMSVVIIGDVKRYGKVVANGNVIVLGTLRGEVIAGASGNNDCYIVAGNVEAATATIGSVTGDVVIRRRGLNLGRASKDPIVIRAWEGELLCEPLSSGLLRQR